MRATTRPDWIDPQLFPFESRFVEVDDSRIHYIDEGTGPVFLFLHGNPTWSFLYRRIVLALRDRFRCVALDHPGFGLSSAPAGFDFQPAKYPRFVGALIQTLDLTDITLMVQDWGGPIGLATAERDPGRFRGLVIANSFAWPLNGKFQIEVISRLVGSPIGRVLVERFNAFVNWGIPAAAEQKLSPEVMRAYLGPFSTPGTRRPTRVFPRALLGSRTFLSEVERNLPRLRHLPALIVWGQRDWGLTKTERRRFEQAFPDHRTVLLPDAKHFVQEDAPEEIASAIQDWWPNAVGAHNWQRE